MVLRALEPTPQERAAGLTKEQGPSTPVLSWPLWTGANTDDATDWNSSATRSELWA